MITQISEGYLDHICCSGSHVAPTSRGLPRELSLDALSSYIVVFPSDPRREPVAPRKTNLLATVRDPI